MTRQALTMLVEGGHDAVPAVHLHIFKFVERPEWLQQ
jgi:hypothetical protein